jgi:hypothetical protein
VKVIRIKTQRDIEKGIKTLNNIRRLSQKLSRTLLRKYGERLEYELRESAFKSGITPFESRNLNIRWEQSPNANSGALYMSNHLVALDGFKRNIHFVNVKRSRPTLLRWALVKGNPSIQRRAKLVFAGRLDKFAIGVRRRPFIKAGWQRTRRALPRMIKSEQQKLMKNV